MCRISERIRSLIPNSSRVRVPECLRVYVMFSFSPLSRVLIGLSRRVQVMRLIRLHDSLLLVVKSRLYPVSTRSLAILKYRKRFKNQRLTYFEKIRSTRPFRGARVKQKNFEARSQESNAERKMYAFQEVKVAVSRPHPEYPLITSFR